MKIILIAYHFPPDPAVGSLRAAKVADSLVRAGHTVRVIAAELEGQGAAATPQTKPVDESDPLQVIRVRALRHVRDFYAGWKHGTGSPPPRAETVERSDHKEAAQTRTPDWKRLVFSLMWLPDDRQGFIVPAVRCAHQLARTGGADVIYTSAPPFSVHLTGLILKRMTGLQWFAEFRDPWTDSPKSNHVRSRLSDAAEAWLEKQCLRNADRVITVTSSAGARFAAKVDPDDAGKVQVIRNGIDRLLSKPVRTDSDDTLRVLYLGNVYHHRDPRPFLAAVAAVRPTLDIGGRRLQIDFIGQCSHYRGQATIEMAAEYGLQDVVNIHGVVPHSECERRLDQADLLLLLAQQQPLQVPNKLYEYLGSRKTILAFADESGETAAMLRTVGGHHVVTSDDPGHAAQVVRSALMHCIRPDGSLQDDVLNGWSTSMQMSRLQSVVGG